MFFHTFEYFCRYDREWKDVRFDKREQNKHSMYFWSFVIFFITLHPILDFAINSARNSFLDLFPNQRGL